MVIDATGDGDVAYGAGVPFELGRERDGLCQPGTVSVRLAGADVDKLTENGDGLGKITKAFREDYRAGKVDLACKRRMEQNLYAIFLDKYIQIYFQAFAVKAACFIAADIAIFTERVWLLKCRLSEKNGQ